MNQEINQLKEMRNSIMNQTNVNVSVMKKAVGVIKASLLQHNFLNARRGNAAENAAGLLCCEVSLWLAVLEADLDGFFRYYAQCKAYFAEVQVDDAGDRALALGLNLAMLLVQNRTGDFHAELEWM